MELDVKAITEIVTKVINACETEDELLVPVGVSNRHIHLSREHLDILFGEGYECFWWVVWWRVFRF